MQIKSGVIEETHEAKTFVPEDLKTQPSSPPWARNCPTCASSARTRLIEDRCGFEPVMGEIERVGSSAFEGLKDRWGDEGKHAPVFPYGTCDDCGLVHAEVYPTDAALGALYAGLSDNMEMVAESARRKTQAGYARAIGALPKGGRYLEIGPDTGIFLQETLEHPVFQAADFSGFTFLEPNTDAHTALNSLPLPGDIDVQGGLALSADSGPFSLAILIHVLDHLRHPQSVLEAISDQMLPGGKILVVTHNQTSLISRLTGRRWPGYHAQHPQLYSKSTLTDALERAGFVDVAIENTKNYLDFNGLFSMGTQVLGAGARSLGPLGRWQVGLPLGNMLAVAVAN